MPTQFTVNETPDLDSDKPTDLESLLAEWEPYHQHARVEAARHSADGKIPIVGTVGFDATIEDVKRAWGGGKYRFMVRAREAFTGPTKRHARGSIVGQVTVDLEGEPIARLAGNLAAALREADESPRGAPPARLPEISIPTGPGGDMSMIALAFQTMMQSQQLMAERESAQRAETRDMFMAMMQYQRRDADPLDMLDRILDIRGKIGVDGDVGVGTALMAALPQLGGAVEKIIAKLPDRAPAPPRPAPELRIAGTEKDEPAQAPPASAPQYGREQRIALALQTLAAGVTDPEMEPEAMARVIASLVGSEIAYAMAQEPTTVDQVLEAAPNLADHRPAIEAVHRELSALFEPGDEGDPDDEPGSIAT